MMLLLKVLSHPLTSPAMRRRSRSGGGWSLIWLSTSSSVSGATVCGLRCRPACCRADRTGSGICSALVPLVVLVPDTHTGGDRWVISQKVMWWGNRVKHLTQGPMSGAHALIIYSTATVISYLFCSWMCFLELTCSATQISRGRSV